MQKEQNRRDITKTEKTIANSAGMYAYEWREKINFVVVMENLSLTKAWEIVPRQSERKANGDSVPLYL